jgi:hypothetical protein
MSTRTRALVIGLMGPFLAAVGLLWLAVDSLVDPHRGALSPHYLMFSAPHLVIAAGTALSFMSIPLALLVAVAEPAEVEIPLYDRDLEPEGDDLQAEPASR